MAEYSVGSVQFSGHKEGKLVLSRKGVSLLGTAGGKVFVNWGSGQAEVHEGPRKMTQEMEVFILGRLQSIPGRALILQEIHRQCLGTGLGEADWQGRMFQSL